MSSPRSTDKLQAPSARCVVLVIRLKGCDHVINVIPGLLHGRAWTVLGQVEEIPEELVKCVRHGKGSPL
jgi:hypothetical protein